MKPTKSKSATAAFEQSLAKPNRPPRYELRLYVAGMTPRSTRAIANIKEICEEHLKELYDLQVIDLYQQPMLAEGDQIIAVPTLLRKLPMPLRRLIGDLSDRERVLIGLDLKPAAQEAVGRRQESE
jgi:circadian clock protein KaiB